MAQIKSKEATSMPRILHPAFAHRWRVNVGSELIEKQAVSCTIDMKKSELLLKVQQPAAYGQELLRDINRVGKGTCRVLIEMLDGAEGVTGTIGGYGELLEHNFVLDYADGGIATHTLRFKYTQSM